MSLFNHILASLSVMTFIPHLRNLLFFSITFAMEIVLGGHFIPSSDKALEGGGGSY